MNDIFVWFFFKKEGEALADSSGRPRRAMKTISTTSEKVQKAPLKAHVAKGAPKAFVVTKSTQGTSKVSTTVWDSALCLFKCYSCMLS